MEVMLTGPTEHLLQYAWMADQAGLSVQLSGTFAEMLSQDFGFEIGGEETPSHGGIPADVMALIAQEAKSPELRRLQAEYYQRCIGEGLLVIRSAAKLSKDVWVYGAPIKRKAVSGLRPSSGRLQVEVPHGIAVKSYPTFVVVVSGNDEACSIYLTSREAVEAAVVLTLQAAKRQRSSR